MYQIFEEVFVQLNSSTFDFQNQSFFFVITVLSHFLIKECCVSCGISDYLVLAGVIEKGSSEFSSAFGIILSAPYVNESITVHVRTKINDFTSIHAIRVSGRFIME